MVAGGRQGGTGGLHGMPPGGGGGDHSAELPGEERQGSGAQSAGVHPAGWEGVGSRGRDPRAGRDAE